MSSIAFTWLHLSDLHAGQKNQDWLWPTFKTQLFEDLRRVHGSTGGWDAVVFSGDLTQQATRAEFDELDRVLTELWEQFDKLGCAPKLITAPGNHDLARPDELDPETMALLGWWEQPALRESFFTPKGLRYLDFCRQAFGEYQSWIDRLPHLGLPTASGGRGLIPGDRSVTLDKDGFSVGFAVLNSSWLQLSGDDFRAKLHVDPRQLLAICDSDPDRWSRQHDLNILVTHHPKDWLHPDSQALWTSEVAASGRFDLHMFGHMHSSDAQSVARGGGARRSEVQAASLFGLRRVQRGNLERAHGYAAWKAEIIDGRVLVRSWPRIVHDQRDGGRRLAADVALGLEENNSYLFLDYPRRTTGPVSPVVGSPLSVGNDERALNLAPRQPSLAKFSHTLMDLRAHANIRKVEQRELTAFLDQSSVCWLIHDWGLGSDGFIAAVQSTRGQASAPSFRFDLSSYTSREQFLADFLEDAGVSFEAVCGELANIGPALLILDDIPTEIAAEDGISLVADVEGVADAVATFCPQLTILLRTRRTPTGYKLPAVQLGALDEADLLTYVQDHELGSKALVTPHAVAMLHRHTDGVLARVDAALRELEVIPLSELVNSNADISPQPFVDDRDDLPPHLLGTLEQLSLSRDDTVKRAMALLNALSIFPQGEQLSRIRRFNGPQAFYPAHARELIVRGLIEAVPGSDGAIGVEAEATRRLLVPRLVRAAVRSRLSDAEYRSLNRKAADLIFGSGWIAGNVKVPADYKFDNPHRSFSEITNAGTILLRLIADAKRPNMGRQLSSALNLSILFCRWLFKGHHYRSIVHFCSDLITILPDDGYEETHSQISFELARALRMTGEHKKALELFQHIRGRDFQKGMRQQLLLNLALTYERTNDAPEALETARETVRVDKQSSFAMQAQAIIANLENQSDRIDRLTKIELAARRKGRITVANNIALELAKAPEYNSDQSAALLERVAQGAIAGNDYYNAMRAIVALGEAALNEHRQLRTAELSQVMAAYHFCFAERLPGLLDQCHDVLWRSFKLAGDTTNMLNLFRQSSLHWRLRGQIDKERRYLRDLAITVGDALQQDPRRVDRVVGYFLARSADLPALPAS